MINKRMQDAINEQIKFEIYSANLYLSMSAYIEGKNLKVTQNIIHLGRLYKKFSKTIKFTVESDYQCNLEVKLYASSNVGSITNSPWELIYPQ